MYKSSHGQSGDNDADMPSSMPNRPSTTSTSMTRSIDHVQEKELSSPATASGEQSKTPQVSDKWDVGRFVTCVRNLPGDEKVDLIDRIFVPRPNYVFPYQKIRKANESIQCQVASSV